MDEEDPGSSAPSVPRDIIRVQIERDLLAAEVMFAAADPDAGFRSLEPAVRAACEHTFVPHALDAIRLVAEASKDERSESLRSFVATHPAATYETRRRAGGTDAVGTAGEVLQPSPPDDVLSLAARLMDT